MPTQLEKKKAVTGIYVLLLQFVSDGGEMLCRLRLSSFFNSGKNDRRCCGAADEDVEDGFLDETCSHPSLEVVVEARGVSRCSSNEVARAASRRSSSSSRADKVAISSVEQ